MDLKEQLAKNTEVIKSLNLSDAQRQAKGEATIERLGKNISIANDPNVRIAGLSSVPTNTLLQTIKAQMDRSSSADLSGATKYGQEGQGGILRFDDGTLAALDILELPYINSQIRNFHARADVTTTQDWVDKTYTLKSNEGTTFREYISAGYAQENASTDYSVSSYGAITNSDTFNGIQYTVKKASIGGSYTRTAIGYSKFISPQAQLTRTIQQGEEGWDSQQILNVVRSQQPHFTKSSITKFSEISASDVITPRGLQKISSYWEKELKLIGYDDSDAYGSGSDLPLIKPMSKAPKWKFRMELDAFRDLYVRYTQLQGLVTGTFSVTIPESVWKELQIFQESNTGSRETFPVYKIEVSSDINLRKIYAGTICPDGTIAQVDISEMFLQAPGSITRVNGSGQLSSYTYTKEFGRNENLLGNKIDNVDYSDIYQMKKTFYRTYANTNPASLMLIYASTTAEQTELPTNMTKYATAKVQYPTTAQTGQQITVKGVGAKGYQNNNELLTIFNNLAGIEYNTNNPAFAQGLALNYGLNDTIIFYKLVNNTPVAPGAILSAYAYINERIIYTREDGQPMSNDDNWQSYIDNTRPSVAKLLQTTASPQTGYTKTNTKLVSTYQKNQLKDAILSEFILETHLTGNNTCKVIIDIYGWSLGELILINTIAGPDVVIGD